MTVKEKLWNTNYVKVLTANFTLFFSFMLLTPLLPIYLSDTYGADKDTIGVVLSGYTVVSLVVRLFSGYIVDSFPRRMVLLAGFLVFSLFFAGYLVTGSLLLFAIARTLHGAPFGLATVANSTVAIDVLPSSRRTEGIGYYGLSNNVATAISPTVALWIFAYYKSYDLLFFLSLLVALCGFFVNATVKIPSRELKTGRPPISLDRFILLKGWSQSLTMMCFSFSYGVVSTYVAIYGREELGVEGGTGLFFMLLASGLFLSRLTGGRSLRQGRIVHNASEGMLLSLFGYALFAALHNEWGYYGAALIVGLGNGHMYPAFQNMLINLAPNDRRGTANSTLLVSWDVGVGIGILVGGVVTEYTSFGVAFWVAWAVNAVGVASYFLYSRGNFVRNRLR